MANYSVLTPFVFEYLILTLKYAYGYFAHIAMAHANGLLEVGAVADVAISHDYHSCCVSEPQTLGMKSYRWAGIVGF